MQKNQDSRLGTENITKLMISLAIPAVLAQIGSPMIPEETYARIVNGEA